MIIRLFDILFSFLGILFLSPIFLILFFLILINSKSPMFFQVRIGKNMKKFHIIKFRTMKIDTENKPTHLINKDHVTKFGKILRKTKLDEIPQLICVLKGDMSLVGPRPCLINQKELINERKKKNIFSVRPGITGLAQIYGFDMSNPKVLCSIERKMLINLNLKNYFKYLFLTFLGKGFGDRIIFDE